MSSDLPPDPVPSSAASTIIIVPREAFASTPATVANVCGHREHGARLLVVDAGSPRHIRQELEALAEQHDFALLRVDRYVTPNQARNLAMRQVTTPYAVFLDNNVWVTAGWLTALERCAAETAAAVVVPKTITVELGRTVVHQMGGDAHIDEHDGLRTLRNSHLHQGEAPEKHTDASRALTEEAEFHAVLVDSAWLRKVGGLDEELYSLFEHTDVCMQIRAAGGSVWFEPASVVSYGRPRFIDRRDRAYYVLRWSEDWNARSGRRFQSVWRLDEDPSLPVARWANTRRRYAYRPFTTPFNRMGRYGRPVVDLVDRMVQRRVVAAWQRSAAEPLTARTAHIASWQRQ
jgi:hypothetical protein